MNAIWRFFGLWCEIHNRRKVLTEVWAHGDGERVWGWGGWRAFCVICKTDEFDNDDF